MIDESLMPFPVDAPAPGACVRIERPEPGLCRLVLDPPHRSLAVLDGPLLRDFEAAVSDLEREKGLRAVVLAGATPLKFAAGADLDGIAAVDDAAVVARLVRAVHAVFARFEALPVRRVAAVGGPVPGGAFELSLCCDTIVIADDPSSRIGLPETQLGIVPGFGGCHRLPKRVGLIAAMTAITTGRLYPAKQARSIGLVDRLAAPENLLQVADDLAMGRQTVRKPARGFRGKSIGSRVSRLLDRFGPFRQYAAGKGRKAVLKKTNGHYPAPLRAVDLLEHARTRSTTEAADREALAIADLAPGPVAKNLIAIFQGTERAKKLGRQDGGGRVARVGVIGAGVMGRGIASHAAMRGVGARLSDISQDAIDAAVHTHRKDVARSAKKRRQPEFERIRSVDRLEAQTGLDGFGGCDLVIEAVAERLDVKRAVFGEVAKGCGPDTVLATNTSSLSVGAIAEGLDDPGRVVGMHFFNPVAKMPLVEIVEGPQTRGDVTTTVCRLALALGKTPVVVRDVPGFLVNRVLGPYLDEAVRLFERGVSVTRIDKLLVEYGMPMGPFTLLDEVGIDVAAHAAVSLHEGYGDRMRASELLAERFGPDRLGRKTGKGFYRHDGSKRTPMSDLDSFARPTGSMPDDDEIVDRLVLALCNEAARCLDEKVAESAAVIDMAVILGTGFAPFRGGPLRSLETRGFAQVVRRLGQLRDGAAVPERFEPADCLRDADDGAVFDR